MSRLEDAIKPDEEFSTLSLKRLLLNVIIVKTYVDGFDKFEDEYGQKEYTPHRLGKFVEEYNQGHYNLHFPDRNATGDPHKDRQLSRGMGGAKRINDIYGKQNIQKLISDYNALLGAKTETSYSASLELIDADLAESLPEGDTREEEAQKKLKTLTFYRLFIEYTFLWIHTYSYGLIAKGKTEGIDINTFLTDGYELDNCWVKLEKGPFRKLAKAKKASLETNNQPVQDTIYNLPPERYIAHYLSPSNLPTGAEIRLFWDNDELKGVILIQSQGFILLDKPLTFRCGPTGIQTPIGGKSYFITLESDIKKGGKNPITFMQIAIEKRASEPPHRTGFFSSILITIKDKNKELKEWETTPIGGGVILQEIPDNTDCGKFLDDLNVKSPESLDASQKTYSELIRQGWTIRYRLLNKLVTIRPNARTQSEQNWNLLQHYVGTYTCYYIRLSKKPPSFETSRIVVNPDGTATLRQDSSSEVSRGIVKVKDNRLWFYFGENDITGKEPVRFLVYNTKAAKKDPLLKGIFQSETLTDKALVSGRMLMQRHSSTKVLPELISIPHNELEVKHIKVEFLPFFTGTDDENKNLTDGPLWKEINDRFARHQDLKIINELRRAGEYFYYYVFKNISTSNKKEFVLERNRLVLNADGTVMINSAYCDYTGTASYRRKTIKLSMVDENRGNGFLEIFLDYDYDATPSPKDSRILYGASLWHSGDRIESKAVVLSRIESFPDGNEWTELASETAKLHFFLPEADQKELHELDIKTRGVVGYLRGEHNRYLQIPRQIPRQLSYTEMRPRDRASREPYFMAACYLGSLISKVNPGAEPSNNPIPERFVSALEEPVTDLKAIMEACTDQLKQAFLHGYACDFAGLRLEPELANTNSEYVLAEYRKAFPSVIPDALYTIDTVKRIQEIAAEQLDLKKAFGPNGPLHVNELRTFAADYWPRLLKVSDSQATSTGQTTNQ